MSQLNEFSVETMLYKIPFPILHSVKFGDVAR